MSPTGKRQLIGQYNSWKEYCIRTIIGHYIPVLILIKTKQSPQKHRLIYTLISLYIKYFWCIITTKNLNIINKDHVCI